VGARARIASTAGACVLALAMLAGACSSTTSSSGTGSSPGTGSAPGAVAGSVPNASEAASLRPLHAVRGDGARILDDQGRQVLLRGVNLNSLGDYYQPNAAYPQVIPVTDADWGRMAANGFDVVRLIVHWSLLEPTRGTIDQGYLDRIQAAVTAAAAHGLYTVIDMHQDAWSKGVDTPAGVTCPAGTEPNNGWDGAPAWATMTDGADTCAPGGVRELAPAVVHAFEHFYANTDGIQDELVNTWAAVAKRFATTDAVAGYDLLNEPNWGETPAQSGQRLGAFTSKVITAIRGAEQQAGGTSHTIYFEPVVVFPRDGTLVPTTDVTDPNVVFAPHNYEGSIDSGTIEEGFANIAKAASGYGTTFWIGEFGWFGDGAKDQASVATFAAQEDQYRVGGTWWQWKQACGDPHSIGTRDGKPADVIVEFNLIGCPADVDKGPVPEWQPILARAYPRAAPGMLESLTSDGLAGTFSMIGARGDAPADAQLDLWVPAKGGQPTVGGTGLHDVQVRPVDGGFRVTAGVCDRYTVTIAPGTPAAGTTPATSC
jgi:endoglycosylceramidase